MAKECYSMKLDLLTNASIVNDAVKIVEKHKHGNNNNNKIMPAVLALVLVLPNNQTQKNLNRKNSSHRQLTKSFDLI